MNKRPWVIVIGGLFCLFAVLALLVWWGTSSSPSLTEAAQEDTTPRGFKFQRHETGSPDIHIMTDKLTGCQYLTVWQEFTSTIVPRLGIDGKPICE